MITTKQLRDVAHVMLNIDKDKLSDAGIIPNGKVGGGDWKRFNDEPLMFILKLPEDRLAKLVEIVNLELA